MYKSASTSLKKYEINHLMLNNMNENLQEDLKQLKNGNEGLKEQMEVQTKFFDDFFEEII